MLRALLRVMADNLTGGMWMLLIGLLLYNAAGMSYQQLLVRHTLEGEPLKRFMNDSPADVPQDTTIEELLDNKDLRSFSSR